MTAYQADALSRWTRHHLDGVGGIPDDLVLFLQLVTGSVHAMPWHWGLDEADCRTLRAALEHRCPSRRRHIGWAMRKVLYKHHYGLRARQLPLPAPACGHLSEVFV